MILGDELRALLELATTALPTARSLRAYFEPRARAITTAGPDPINPPWAKVVSGAADVFVELEGDLLGARLWDDSRGWGTYVELAVARGTLAELEAVTGPLAAPPRMADGGGLAMAAAYLERAGHQLRVFARHAGGAVKSVTIHFPPPASPPITPRTS